MLTTICRANLQMGNNLTDYLSKKRYDNNKINILYIFSNTGVFFKLT